MFKKLTILLPILRLKVKPLTIYNKELPLTLGLGKIIALEYENIVLRRENQSLRG